MKRHERKTSGVDWLGHSMVAFNGSGYADKYDAEAYVQSYIAYKLWRNDEYALEQIAKYPTAPMGFAVELVHANDPSHVPREKSYNKFLNYYDPVSHKVIHKQTQLNA